MLEPLLSLLVLVLPLANLIPTFLTLYHPVKETFQGGKKYTVWALWTANTTITLSISYMVYISGFGRGMGAALFVMIIGYYVVPLTTWSIIALGSRHILSQGGALLSVIPTLLITAIPLSMQYVTGTLLILQLFNAYFQITETTPNNSESKNS